MKIDLIVQIRNIAVVSKIRRGWDEVVEASDDELRKRIGDAATIEEAIARVNPELEHPAKPASPELVTSLKRHALDHYEQDGWDYVVETFDDEELAEEIAGATTLEEAIAQISPYLKRLNERRRDIQAEAF